jgi:hypothetical protein
MKKGFLKESKASSSPTTKAASASGGDEPVTVPLPPAPPAPAKLLVANEHDIAVEWNPSLDDVTGYYVQHRPHMQTKGSASPTRGGSVEVEWTDSNVIRPPAQDAACKYTVGLRKSDACHESIFFRQRFCPPILTHSWRSFAGGWTHARAT